MTLAGAAPATEITSVAGSAVVTPRLSSRPMRRPRPVKEVSSAGGAVSGRISQGRCPRLELYEAKVSRTVLRGREGSNPLLLPGLRHEGVAETVLHIREEVTTPVVLPAVCYRGVRSWQRGGAKPSAQRTLILRGGSKSASRCCDCQHQGGWGPAGVVWSTQVNRCSAVTKNKPKVLTGLDQKGKWPGPDASNSSGADVEPPAYGRDLTHAVSATQRGKPVALPLGKRVVRRADGAAGMRSGRKPRPACSGPDRG
jgi:hypothetical protein